MKEEINYSDPTKAAPAAPLPAHPDDKYLIVVPSEEMYAEHEKRARLEEEKINELADNNARLAQAAEEMDAETAEEREAEWERERAAREK